MSKSLGEVLPPGVTVEGTFDPRLTIQGLAYDSRKVGPGFLFFALKGLHVDGHDHIGAAVGAGASAVVHEAPVPVKVPGVAYIRVADSRAAMSPIAARYHGFPSKKLAVVGVTGTEGKSTTVWLIYRLLDLAGRRTGFVSTVEYRVGDVVLPNPEHQTTPEATTVQEQLARMVDSGFEYAVIEASSHGLSPRTGRLDDVEFDAGLVTNVRHEHLEFHGTWERYRDDKANLFRALDATGHRKTLGGKNVEFAPFGVICADDPSATYFAGVTKHPVYTYSAAGKADLWADAAAIDERGASFVIHQGAESYPARIELPGAFNIENVLGAALMAHKLAGIPIAELVPLLPKLEPVKGRMTRVDKGQPFEVLVDYAHTPSSFETVLPSIRRRVNGRVICVFGSGGERDVQKRPAQGRIASEYCDIVILSDEDPRGEEPMVLLEDIAAGCVGKRRGVDLLLIPDRAAAIRKAIALAEPGGAILLLGKSHENTIIYADGPIPWDEISEAGKALEEAGFGIPGRRDGKGE